MAPRRKLSSYVSDSEDSSDGDVKYIPANQRSEADSYIRRIAETSISPVFDGDMHKLQTYESCEEVPSKASRRAKCTSRNAIIARQNRIRKKMYIQNLESEVSRLKNCKSKLRSIVDNQSILISELQREVKYMKSVLANSADLSKLIKNIRCSTGMSVTTSLDKSLTMNNNCVSKREGSVARKTAHPWEEQCQEDDIDTSQLLALDTFPKMESTEDLGFPDLDLPLDMNIPFPDFLINFGEDLTSTKSSSENNHRCDSYSEQIKETSTHRGSLNDHNYTTAFTNNCFASKEDVGVCLHVSQHRVSLEFCSSCSENAIGTWKELD